MKSWMSVFVILAAPAAAQQIDGDVTTHELVPTCVHTMHDQATGDCIGVSSTPTLGMLYPLGPDFYFDPSGQLRLGGTVVVDGDVAGDSLFGSSVLAGSDGIRVFEGGRVAIYSTGEITAPQAELHISNFASAEILLEADWDNVNELDHPKVRFSQDDGAVQAFVGFQDGLNDFTMRNLYVSGGMRFDLYTGSTRDWEFRRRASTATDVEARITQSGNLQIDGSLSTPAADLAEFYPVEGEIEPGDVVAFSGNGLWLERARTGAAGRLAGVISSRPAITLGLSYSDEEEPGVEYAPPPDEPAPDVSPHGFDPAVAHEIDVNRRAPLALSGRVPCKVSAENGRIAIGDLLTLSSIPGHAAKAIASGAVVGTALEDWNAGQGTILVLVHRGWYSPSEDLERRLAELEAQVKRLLAGR